VNFSEIICETFCH